MYILVKKFSNKGVKRGVTPFLFFVMFVERECTTAGPQPAGRRVGNGGRK